MVCINVGFAVAKTMAKTACQAFRPQSFFLSRDEDLNKDQGFEDLRREMGGGGLGGLGVGRLAMRGG